MSNTKNGTRTTSESQPNIYTGSDIEALQELTNVGAHLVLASRKKVPIREGWLTRPPSPTAVLHHAERGGLVGVVPWSLGFSVIDVDEGSPNGLLSAHAPLTGWPTRREGGVHLVYRDTMPRDNSKFEQYGCSGDIRGSNGFAILWGDAPTRLADSLAYSSDYQCMFPAYALFPGTESQVQPVCTTDPTNWLPTVQGHVNPTDIDLAQVYPGSRNHYLFLVVLGWAYKQVKDMGEDAWNALVYEHAINCNELMPVPLPQDEVHKLAYSASQRVWTRHLTDFHNDDSEIQAKRARRKAYQLWQKHLPRNLQILEFSKRGMTQREIGRMVGLSQGAVANVLAKWASLG